MMYRKKKLNEKEMHFFLSMYQFNKSLFKFVLLIEIEHE